MAGSLYNTPCRFNARVHRHASPVSWILGHFNFGTLIAGFCVVISAIIIGLPTAEKPTPLSLQHVWLEGHWPDGAYGINEIQAVVREASLRFDVPKELIWAVISVESDFDPSAKSHAGAMGLMQLMPGTAGDLKVKNPYNPRQNILGGTKYLRDLLKQFKGDQRLALAAYNAGPGNVQRYGGVPPYRETQNYVKKVLARYAALKRTRALVRL